MKSTRKIDLGVSGSIQEDETGHGFHERLKNVLENWPSERSFAQKAGMSVSGFKRVLEGGWPNLPNLIKISDASGRSVQWLAIGEEATQPEDVPQYLNMELLTTVIEGLEENLLEQGKNWSPNMKARAIPLLYQYFLAQDDSEERAQFAQSLLKIM